MKLASFYIFSVFLLLGFFADASVSTVKWEAKHDPKVFVDKVVKVCQRGSQGSVSLDGRNIEVTGEPECIHELKTMSERWERAHEEDIAAIYTASPSNNDRVYKSIQRKVPESLLRETGVLKFNKACPCLAFLGGHAQKIVDLAEQIK